MLHRSKASFLLVVILSLALSALAPLAHIALADDQPPASPTATATVTVPVLNVRSGPGTGYTVLDRVAGGTLLTVIGQNAAGDWLNVQAPGGLSGWVSAVLVSQGAAVVDPAQPVRIVAPAIGMDARVVSAGWHVVYNADGSTGSDWDVPAYAAGWLITSALPGQGGNTVLAGHHNIDGEVFRYVVNLKPGDAITLYTGGGTFNYKVTDRFILPDKYVSYQQRLANAQWIGPFADERLTLVTCWPYTNNTHRVIVIAKPVSQ